MLTWPPVFFELVLFVPVRFKVIQKINDPIEYLKGRKIVSVDLKFSNLFGGWHHVTIPASGLSEDIFTKGVGFDGGSIPGFKKVESGDMVLLPDRSTAFLDSFWDMPTLSMICDIAEADTKVSFLKDPRGVARRAESHLKATGIADESRWGPEFEYYVFDSVEYLNEPYSTGYDITSEEVGNSGNSAGKAIHPISLQGGYHAIPPLDTLYNMRSEAAQLIEEFGIKVIYHHHEVGGPGQSEIEVERHGLTVMADAVMAIKYFIKMIAHKYNKYATFMPKPLYHEAGNGMHFHQHLFKDGKPLFYEKGNYADMSRLALSYIAGILDHGPALLAFTNPSTNSYKRLIPGFEAPVNLFFSLANRSAAIRIPKYASSPEEKRMEFRPPDATCNAYLAMSAMLMAGIDGIKRNLDPTEMGFGPIDENIFAWPEEKRGTIKPLPSSVKSAMEHLEKDSAFLLEGGVFNENIIETWISHKINKEYNAVRNRPHPYEMELYFDV